MSNSIWSGHLNFGLVSMPIKLYPGARTSSISFNMLHRDCLSRVKQQYFCPTDNRVVDRDEIVKGFEYREDEYIVVESEDLKRIEPKTARTMEITEFVKAGEVDPVYFESSYFLMPDESGKRAYALLSRALEQAKAVALAKLSMHNREYTVFVRPHQGGLMLHTMYYEEEIRAVEGFGAPEVELKPAEIRAAQQFINALAADWDPTKYRDEFQDNVKQLIKTKLEGGTVEQVAEAKRLEPVSDLIFAMKQSLAQIEHRKRA
jgi:DNA end-binding protein Ku